MTVLPDAPRSSSAGGYHHHLGFNIWRGRGVGPAPAPAPSACATGRSCSTAPAARHGRARAPRRRGRRDRRARRRPPRPRPGGHPGAARPRREVRRRAGRARVVVILGALSAFGPLSIDMYLPGLPALGATLDAPASAVQLTLTACLAGLALGQIVAGPLSDRFGRRRPLLVGVAAYAAASLLCALAPSIARARRAALRPGHRRRGRDRDRARDRARPALGRRRRAVLLAADARQRPRADPRAGDRRPGAARHDRGAACSSCSPRSASLLRRRRGVRPARDARARGPRTRAASPRRSRRSARCSATASSSATRSPAASRSARCSPTSRARRSCSRTSTAPRPSVFSVMFARQRARASSPPARPTARCCAASSRARSCAPALVARRAPAVALLAVVARRRGRVGHRRRCSSSSWRASASCCPNATALALADHPRVAGSASALLGVLQFIVGAAAAPLVGVAGPAPRCRWRRSSPSSASAASSARRSSPRPGRRHRGRCGWRGSAARRALWPRCGGDRAGAMRRRPLVDRP